MVVREFLSGVVAALGACGGAVLGGSAGFLLGGVGDLVLGAGSLIPLVSLAGLVGGGFVGVLVGIYMSLRSADYPVPGLTTILFALIFPVSVSLSVSVIVGRNLMPLWLVVVWQYPAVGWALLPISLLAFSLARIAALRHHAWHQHHHDRG